MFCNSVQTCVGECVCVTDTLFQINYMNIRLKFGAAGVGVPAQEGHLLGDLAGLGVLVLVVEGQADHGVGLGQTPTVGGALGRLRRRTHTHTHTHTLTHSSLSHTHTHTNIHIHTHPHTDTHTHTHTHSLTNSS